MFDKISKIAKEAFFQSEKEFSPLSFFMIAGNRTKSASNLDQIWKKSDKSTRKTHKKQQLITRKTQVKHKLITRNLSAENREGEGSDA